MNLNLNVNQERNTLFAGNLFKNGSEMTVQEKIAQKRQLYGKQAAKMIKDADTTERKIDKSIEDARAMVKENIDLIGENGKKIKEMDEHIAQAKEQFGIEDDSQEQKDLEILLKAQRQRQHVGMSAESRMTEEESERYEEIKGQEPTDYQKMALDFYAQRDEYSRESKKAEEKITAINDVIRKIRIDRPASQVMLDAQRNKEELMDAASKEIYGMLIEDAKDKIDEKAEEVKEAAEKREEAKEELEERLEAAKEDKEQSEEAVESAQEAAAELAKHVIESDDLNNSVDEEIKKRMEALQKQLEELKGIAIDQSV